MDRTLEDVERDIASALAAGDAGRHKYLVLEKKLLEGVEEKRQRYEQIHDLSAMKAEVEAELDRIAKSSARRAEEWDRKLKAFSAELKSELKSELKEVVAEHFRLEEEEEEQASWRFRDLFKFLKKKPSSPPVQPAT